MIYIVFCVSLESINALNAISQGSKRIARHGTLNDHLEKSVMYPNMSKHSFQPSASKLPMTESQDTVVMSFIKA